MPFEFIILTIIRILASFLIFKRPLFGILVSSYLDGQDWHYLNLNTDEGYAFYRIWDKVLDLFYLGIAVFVSFSWKDKIARFIGISSFILRTIGVFLFLIFNKGVFLFIFPNFFENFFIFYLLYQKIGGRSVLFTAKKDIYIIVFSLLIPKAFTEYVFHVMNISPYQLLDVEKWFGLKGFFNELFFILIYLSLPVVVLIWALKRK